MTYIRLVSDLHLEIENYEIEPLPEDRDTILILAGDIDTFKRKPFQVWIRQLCPKFHTVLHVAGNHEFYGTTFGNSQEKFQLELMDIPNFHSLNNEYVIIHDILFAGTTLWTNFHNNDPMEIFDAESMMNDYKKIRIGPSHAPWLRKLRPLDTSYACNKAVEFIRSTLKDKGLCYKVAFVITHHAPSYQSIPEHFKTEKCNYAYASNFDDLILELQPQFWVHGHIHDSFDYKIGETRVVCNPKGYPPQYVSGWNPEFNPILRFNVE